ncbi:hypothetical protein H2248_011497 [Termitomyces sp. 'cryptogamus']|nr:hypothetical protein H2248_011497 [Termitomyces sp. 'cryptogamus']
MLDKYLQECQKFTLPCNWQPKEGMSLANWNLNAQLKNTESEHALTNLAIKAHFKLHMHSNLQQRVDVRKLKGTMELVEWVMEVTKLEEELAED